MQVLNNIFPAYMDATLSSDNISVVTDPESQVTTIKIEDMAKGQGVIKDFLINLKPADAESATSKGAEILNNQQAADDTTKPTDITKPTVVDKSLSGIYDLDDLKRAFGADKEAQDILDTNPNSEGVRNVTTLFIQKKIILDMEKRGDAELSSDDFRNINSYYRIASERAGLKSESNTAINKTIQEIVAEQLGTKVPKYDTSPFLIRPLPEHQQEIRRRMEAVRNQERKQVIPDLDVPRSGGGSGYWAGGEIKQPSLLSRAS